MVAVDVVEQEDGTAAVVAVAIGELQDNQVNRNEVSC